MNQRVLSERQLGGLFMKTIYGQSHRTHRTVRLFLMLMLVGILTALIAGLPQIWAANKHLITIEEANQAHDYAMQYVENEVAYLYGGRQSVEAYLAALADGKVPGQDIGADASAVVVNAYRNVIPNIRFFFDQSQKTLVADATSSVIANYNSVPISQDELVPGDLIFFKDASGNINGIAIFSEIKGEVIHFITASANQGKVVRTNAYFHGAFWTNSFAGYGRLQYAIAE